MKMLPASVPAKDRAGLSFLTVSLIEDIAINAALLHNTALAPADYYGTDIQDSVVRSWDSASDKYTIYYLTVEMPAGGCFVPLYVKHVDSPIREIRKDEFRIMLLKLNIAISE
jgi:hypothetical protein